ncbi:ribonuclease R [Bacteroidales bacterium OttesenSCG-928-M11]|nr:ribonuclease R [Bacteroidales bacterium OttesenSCG-928-M11]
MKKKNKEFHAMKSPRRLKKKDIQHRIVDLFNTYPKEIMNYKQVSAEIGVTTSVGKLMVNDILKSLQIEDFLISDDRGKYRLNGIGSTAEGRFERRHNGKNSFIPDNEGAPLFVAERNSMHAMNGDRVRVQILAKRKGREPEAEVLEILERSQSTFVGLLEVFNNHAFLVVDNKVLANDIYISKERLHGGKTGQKAIVKIIHWPERAKNPSGEVVEILGDAGKNDTEMHAILADYGLPYTYPQAIEKQAGKISSKITREDEAEREDFRNTVTFTIDPHDAKDFDDALSIKQLSDETWEIGVHIADVTHYVKPGTAIDKEAYERATSIYLVDRTIPMLPEVLSNKLCSLRPHEDKLCYSVIFEMNSKAQVLNYRIKHTIINSNHRFNYDEAQNVIEIGEGPFKDEIITLNNLAKILRSKRFSSGSVNFDRVEVKFELDKEGKPLRVFFKEAKDSNKLIEEFMLLANRTVAEAIGRVPKNKKAKAFVYRVHDVPNPEKMQNFAEFIRRFGYRFKPNGESRDISRSMNDLLGKVQGKKEQNLIETIAVRAMAKAIYTCVNIGHYGLSFDYYTHFTSPIRRYPDMMVHRLLDRYLLGGRSVPENKLEEECKHCSDQESIASNAERESIKYKQVEFMSDKIGMTFDGVISGVTEWGLYVEINENLCEGMVPMRDLKDDFYEFDEKTYSLLGRRHKHRYSLGDRVKIKVVRANLDKKQLDFTLVDSE